MKRFAYSIFAAMLIVAATSKASAQTEQTREVSGFHSVGSSGPFDVHVKIDGTESLKIVAGSDIINEIETVVESGKLEIKFKHRDEWNRHEHTGNIDIYVTAKSLTGLANAGSGYIKVDGVVSGDNVRIALAGSGNITSSVKSDDLHVDISGSGNVNVNGSANETKIAIAGSGDVMGKQLKTNSASVSIAGSGSAYIAADKTVSAHIAGSGNVIYTGNATIGDSRTAGSGRISKED